jgi:N6-L-threonylcarbamoyladenine synthase
MTILAIDTSCDETSASIIEEGKLLSQRVASQAELQSKWNGVLPSLAQEKHIEWLPGVIFSVISSAAHYSKSISKLKKDYSKFNLLEFENPGIDIIAVTIGPGLAIALEIGLDWAKKLSKRWEIPIMPINHMEGHFLSSLILNRKGNNILNGELPDFQENLVLGGLFSGRHSEIIEYNSEHSYKKYIETVDDAAGEAFDKFSVMIGLGYPGGKVIEELAKEIYRDKKKLSIARGKFPLPIPLNERKNNKGEWELRLSFSGLKTAVLYLIQERGGVENFSQYELKQLAASFQYSLITSISKKFRLLIEIKGFKNLNVQKYLLLGGGVVANLELKKEFRRICRNNDISALFPEKKFYGDNASMIGFAAYLRYKNIIRTAIPTEIISPSDPEINKKLDRLPRFSLSEI